MNVRRGICSCDTCAQAKRRSEKATRVRQALGTQDSLVPAEETVKQVRYLQRIGMSVTYIADKVGYSPNALRRLIGPTSRSKYQASLQNGRRVSSRRAAEVERLYQQVSHERRHRAAGTLEQAGAVKGGMVSIRLSRLALEGLQRQGFSQRWLADRLGLTGHKQVHKMLLTSKMTTPEIEARILTLVQEIGSRESTEPRAQRTKNDAAKKGYRKTLYVDSLV